MNLQLVIYWTSRVSAALASLFILFFMIAHLIGSGEQCFLELNSWNEITLFLFFPVLTLIGLILGWKSPLAGGIVCIAGILGFHIFGGHLNLSLIDVLGIPGLLFLLYVWLNTNQKND